MKKNEPLKIKFPKNGFCHPNYATYYEYMAVDHYVKDYTKQIIKTHHLAVLFPTIDYNELFKVVNGENTLEAVDDDDFYGVIISANDDGDDNED